MIAERDIGIQKYSSKHSLENCNTNTVFVDIACDANHITHIHVMTKKLLDFKKKSIKACLKVLNLNFYLPFKRIAQREIRNWSSKNQNLVYDLVL